MNEKVRQLPVPKRNENKEKRYYKNYFSNDKIKINNIMISKNTKIRVNTNIKTIENKEKNPLKRDFYQFLSFQF